MNARILERLSTSTRSTDCDSRVVTNAEGRMECENSGHQCVQNKCSVFTLEVQNLRTPFENSLVSQAHFVTSSEE